MLHPRVAPGVRGEDGSASHQGPSLHRPISMHVPASHGNVPSGSYWAGALCASTPLERRDGNAGCQQWPQPVTLGTARAVRVQTSSSPPGAGFCRYESKTLVAGLAEVGLSLRLCSSLENWSFAHLGVVLGMAASVSIAAWGSAG